jgi:hypothetical protein
VPPVLVADLPAGHGWRQLRVVTVEPLVDVEDIVLLGPHQPGEGLTLHPPLVLRGALRVNLRVEPVRLVAAPVDESIDVDQRRRERRGREPEPDHGGAAGRDHSPVVQARLRTPCGRIDGRLAVHDVTVEGILDILATVVGRGAVQTLEIRLVIGEQRVPVGLAVQPAPANAVLEGQVVEPFRIGIVRHQGHVSVRGSPWLDHRFTAPVLSPRPDVAEPQVRQQVQLRRLGAAIERLDADAQIVGVRLGVFDEHVEVPVLVEDARIEQLELRPLPAAARVLLDQPAVRILGLRVLVQVLHVAVGRRAVDVEVILLQILAVIPLARDQPEWPLLEDRIPAVPQRQREAQHLKTVADSGQPVFAPAIRLAPRHVVREEVPRGAIGAVVLADGAPGSLAEIRSPAMPLPTCSRFGKAVVLFGLGHATSWPARCRRIAVLSRYQDPADPPTGPRKYDSLLQLRAK